MALPNEPAALYQILDFDIDRYVNPWIPRSRLNYLPQPVSRWLGYRSKPVKEPYAVLQWPVTFLGTVAYLCLAGALGTYAPGIRDWHPPVLIASLGATSVLNFNTIKSPLAQPRNTIVGNTLSAICGVAVAEGFKRYAIFWDPEPHNVRWLAGAIACGLASVVMGITNTIHPPGGATSVLAATSSQVIAMGWRYIPIVLMDSVLIVVVALIFNNVMRQYPLYWWTAGKTGSELRKERREERKGKEDQHKAVEEGKIRSGSSVSNDSDRTLCRELGGPLSRVDFQDGIEDITIRPYKIQMPHHVQLSDEEVELLESIQERLRMHGEVDPRRTS